MKSYIITLTFSNLSGIVIVIKDFYAKEEMFYEALSHFFHRSGVNEEGPF